MAESDVTPPPPADDNPYWRSIPIQHHELDPDFQIVPQASVSAYLGESVVRQPRSRAEPRPRTLDGDMLLDLCNESSPLDVYGAELSSKHIVGVAMEDAPFFLSLASIDLSDNRVPLDQLATFPALRMLNLQCNGLSQLVIPSGGFPALEKLDISVNTISSNEISHLAQLQGLKELDLSGNSLTSLPSLAGFKQLVSLVVANNRLKGDEVFSNMGAAPVLQNLNLEANLFGSLGLLIRCSADAADATVIGGYRGPWHTLQRLQMGNNRLMDVGGMDVLLALPNLVELGVRGNPAFSAKPTPEIYALRQIFEAAEVKFVVGAEPLFDMPQPKMAQTYKASARSMVMVSEGVSQNEYATDPSLWNILDSSDEEEAAAAEDSAAALGDSGPVTAMPARYELDEEGAYRTPADMRAAYSQLRHALSHPDDFMRNSKPKKAGRGTAPSGPYRGRGSGGEEVMASLGGQEPERTGVAAERLSSMEDMLAQMKLRANAMESELDGGDGGGS